MEVFIFFFILFIIGTALSLIINSPSTGSILPPTSINAPMPPVKSPKIEEPWDYNSVGSCEGKIFKLTIRYFDRDLKGF